MPPASKRKKMTLPKSSRKMPVTLVSGFLGSGKTSLLSHVLLNKDHKMKCAVIVNEISDFNVDALAVEGAALLQSEERMVEMSNGCICCTLREDLLEQLVELHKKGFDAVIIESSGIAEPMQVAETFFFPIGGRPTGKTLMSIAPLDNCVTIVDAGALIQHMSSIDSTNTLDKAARDTEDERNIAHLMFDQLEFANVILLNKIDSIGAAAAVQSAVEHHAHPADAAPSHGGAAAPTVDTLVALIRKINPRAKVIATTHSKVDLKEIINTSNFSAEFAISTQGWMDDVKGGPKHTPETEEYGVSSMSYTPKVPFHPQRLFEWIRNYFILDQIVLMTEHDAEEREKAQPKLSEAEQRAKAAAWSEDVARRSANRLARYGNLFRGKGFAWVGNPARWSIYATWSQAGDTLSFGAGGTWDEFPQSSSPEPVAVDPGQRLVFIGQDLKKDVLRADLDALLLTGEETQALATAMQVPAKRHADRASVFPDPFAAFPAVADADEGRAEPDTGDQPQAASKRSANGKEKRTR